MKLICFEGCSGAGKTTQYHILQDKFRGKNVLFAVEKNYEPFKTIVQKWHNEKGPYSLLDQEYIQLFAKARAETFQKNFIGKNLDILILDRYYYTSAVYQCNSEISPKEILSINKEYNQTPQITFLFECDPEIAFQRSDRRNELTGGKHLFSTSAGKIKIIQERYSSLLNFCHEIEVINANKSIEDVTYEILSKL